jgi:hypothetical protein
MSFVPTAADVRSAWRSLCRAPWYAATSIGVIALGVTLTATILAITDGALFKPLPYPDEARVFAIAPGHTALPPPWFGSASPLDVTTWRETVPEAPIAAMSIGDLVTIGQGASVRGARIDDRFFEVLGRQPAVGAFEAADYDAFESVRPAILTHGLWVRAFGGDPTIVGRTVTNREGRGIRVVGILPADLILPDPFRAAVLTPLYNPDPRHVGRSRRVFVRLPEGETPASQRVCRPPRHGSLPRRPRRPHDRTSPSDRGSCPGPTTRSIWSRFGRR